MVWDRFFKTGLNWMLLFILTVILIRHEWQAVIATIGWLACRYEVAKLEEEISWLKPGLPEQEVKEDGD